MKNSDVTLRICVYLTRNKGVLKPFKKIRRGLWDKNKETKHSKGKWENMTLPNIPIYAEGEKTLESHFTSRY